MQAEQQSGVSMGDVVGGVNTATSALNTVSTLSDKNASGKDKAFAAAHGANQVSGMLGNPYAGYIGAGLGAAQVLTSDANAKDKTRAMNHYGQDVAANYFTGGISGAVQSVDRQLLGGQTDKLRNKWDDFQDSKAGMLINPSAYFTHRLEEKTLGALSGGGKSEDQKVSDQYRAVMKQNGIINVDDTGAWNITLRDGKGNAFNYDIGKDGGGGRAAHELDQNGFFEADGTTPTIQGRITGRASALGDLITGADENQATKFAGYFANAGLKAAQGDEEAGRAAMRDLYEQFGYKDAASAIAGIEALRKAGKIDDTRAESQINSINDTFSGQQGAPQQDKRSQSLLETGKDDAKQALEFKKAR